MPAPSRPTEASFSARTSSSRASVRRRFVSWSEAMLAPSCSWLAMRRSAMRLTASARRASSRVPAAGRRREYSPSAIAAMPSIMRSTGRSTRVWSSQRPKNAKTTRSAPTRRKMYVAATVPLSSRGTTMRIPVAATSIAPTNTRPNAVSSSRRRVGSLCMGEGRESPSLAAKDDARQPGAARERENAAAPTPLRSVMAAWVRQPGASSVRTLDHALLGGGWRERLERFVPHPDRALLPRPCRVRRRRGPTGRSRCSDRDADTRRVDELLGARVTDVRASGVVGDFLLDRKVPQRCSHRALCRPRPGLVELRHCDGGEDPDNHHHDQELDEREPAAPHTHGWYPYSV